MAVLAFLLAAPLAPSSPAYPMESREKNWACESRDFMVKFKDAIFAGDKQAVQLGIMSMIAASGPGGTCVQVEKGEKVDVLESEIFAGFVIIRKKGRLGRYYGLYNMFKLK